MNTPARPMSTFPLFPTPESEEATHLDMYQWAADLFPICRSLTGQGVRETIAYLQKISPLITRHEIPTGTECFDWTIPDEWNISEAYVIGPDDRRIIDFKDNNLHVVGYSEPVDTELSLEELLPRLHSDERLPEAIPYVTSYYRRTWGFCLSDRQRKSLQPGRYRVVIRSTLAPGSLTYGEAILPGESDDEIFFSTYVCHPSMANDNLSGPVLTTALLRWLSSIKSRRYTYRFIWIPETLGAISYLSKHLKQLKDRVRAGYVVTCVGDNHNFSYLPSREGKSLADRAALHVLHHYTPRFNTYSFLERGADERQYCYPGIDLPVASIMRSKYDTYPEYHTSLDDMSLISPSGLGGAYEIYRHIISAIENNKSYRATTLCEPCLGKRNLYPTTSRKEIFENVISTVNVLCHADGENDLLDIADKIGLPYDQCLNIVRVLLSSKLLAI